MEDTNKLQQPCTQIAGGGMQKSMDHAQDCLLFLLPSLCPLGLASTLLSSLCLTIPGKTLVRSSSTTVLILVLSNASPVLPKCKKCEKLKPIYNLPTLQVTPPVVLGAMSKSRQVKKQCLVPQYLGGTSTETGRTEGSRKCCFKRATLQRSASCPPVIMDYSFHHPQPASPVALLVRDGRRCYLVSLEHLGSGKSASSCKTQLQSN